MPPRAEGTTGGDDASRVARIWELVSAQAASRRDHAGATDVCAARSQPIFSGVIITMTGSPLASPSRTNPPTAAVNSSRPR